MRRPHPDLHGAAPDKSPWALLLIDVINDFDFPEGDQLLETALPMADKLLALKRRAHAAGVPVIYVNDNFGRWQSNFKAQVEHCLKSDCRGRTFVRRLRPSKHDYFVLKPMHSGFYSTGLDLLLAHLAAKKLVLTGIAGDICVLFTANDAYMRNFKLFIPADCVASNTPDENRNALGLMKKVLKADIRKSTDIHFSRKSR